MLVLSRKRGEEVVVGGQITVTVLAVQGDRVKLGFAAPAEVSIHRKEVFQRVGSAAVGGRACGMPSEILGLDLDRHVMDAERRGEHGADFQEHVGRGMTVADDEMG